jgi:peroxiredoxin
MSFRSGNFPIRLSAVFVFILLFSFSIVNCLAAGKTSLKIGDAPPRIALHDLKGSMVRLPDDFRGKVVILHFWSGGCSSCKEEMPAMETLYGKYGRKGLVILAVNVGQRRDMVKKLVQEIGISYPVLLDTDKEMASKYDVVGLPRTYLVDRNGVIRYKILGAASEEMLKKKILSLL